MYRNGLRVSETRATRRDGELAGIGSRVHRHMLRYPCGFAPAEGPVDTLLIRDYHGHRNIQSRTIYTGIKPAEFEPLRR